MTKEQIESETLKRYPVCKIEKYPLANHKHDDEIRVAFKRGLRVGLKESLKWIPIEEFQKERANGKTLYMSDGYQRMIGYLAGGKFMTFRGGEFCPKRVIILPEDPDNEKP